LGWKDKFPPEIKKLVCVYVPADVIIGPFPEDLLIDPRPVFPPRKVVQDGRSAPPNVEAELHDPPCLGILLSVIHVVRHRHRP
jgi:hypothetical protein